MCYFTNFSETENNALANTLFSECTEFIYILNKLSLYMDCRASQVTQMVKNLPALWKTHVPSLVQKDPLEEGAKICPSILAWRIPWTEEPGGLQSMGSQKSQTRPSDKNKGNKNTGS